jgi:thioredoxin-like negative regulator of GroEL
VARDAAQAFQVNAIPNFIAFHNGKQFKNFKGADEQALFSTISSLAEKLPKGKVNGAKGHDQMRFK